ncbi:MAG: MATE family efflux transporter [Ruminococcaceae bacterium]|nr:MATE family efflux transporter [Oscillospiraceae bacterium]
MANSNLDSQFVKMTESKIEPLVLKLAVPSIISMLVSSLYNMADTFFVGQVGTSATAAVGVSFTLMAMIQAIGFFFGHGSGNYISRAMGNKEYSKATTMASVGFYSAVAVGVLITVLGLIFLKPLAVFMGSTKTILPHACEYMKYILLAAPFMTGSFVLNNQLRFQGRAMYSMIGITAGGVLNILLDPLFIFAFDMKVAGAALATMISQGVSFVILIIMASKKGIGIDFHKLTVKGYYYKEIFRGGIPSLARQGCGSLSTLCLNNVAAGYSDAAVAAVSIVSKLMLFAMSALIGYGQGFQPVCGVNYGAGNYNRVKKAYWFCVKTATVVQIIFAVTGFVFAPKIIPLFRDDPAVINIGSIVLRWQCITFPFSGFNVLSNMMAQTIGKAVKATVLALSRQFLFFVPSIFILNEVFGLQGLEAAQTSADICALIVCIPITASLLKEMKSSQSE